MYSVRPLPSPRNWPSAVVWLSFKAVACVDAAGAVVGAGALVGGAGGAVVGVGAGAHAPSASSALNARTMLASLVREMCIVFSS